MSVVGTSELKQEFKVQVLELPAGEAEEEGSLSTLALIVLRRLTGLLLAVPVSFFSEEVLTEGLTAAADEQIGQSVTLTLPAGTVQDLEATGQPVQVPDAEVEVVLADVTLDIAEHLKPFNHGEHPLNFVMAFSMEDPKIMPMVDNLVEAAWTWVLDPGSGERAAFYSATEEEFVPETPQGPKTPKARARQRVERNSRRRPDLQLQPCRRIWIRSLPLFQV